MEKPKAASQPITDTEAGALAGAAARRAEPIAGSPISDQDAGGMSGGLARSGGDDDDLEELEVQR